MKKIIAIVVAAAMVLGMNSTAFANDGGSGMNPNNPKGVTEIQFTPSLGESYVVTISAKVTVNDPDEKDEKAKLTVEASDVRLRDSHQVEVSVNSSNGWSMEDKTGTSKIIYSCFDSRSGKERSIANGDTVLTVAGTGIGQSAKGDVSLDISTTSEAVAAATVLGKHTDTLTFTCAMAEK